MKQSIIITILILSINLYGQPQTVKKVTIDSTLAKKISISGFCLCQTTLTDLRKSASDLKPISVEEMDIPKECFSQDTRYVNGQGFYSKQYPGLIFQKEEENSDYISKIRLTKEFVGNLPNGKHIELGNLKLKDVFLIYPELKNSWGSRGCSDYWNFSNDTISFFVRIDKNIKPQFPINKEYYLDKPVEAIDLLISCYSLFHKSKDLFTEPTNEPLFYLDSINVNSGVLNLYQPNDIAAVTVYKDSNAIKIAGEKGKFGVIYITTKNYARDRYWTYFKSKSSDYTKAVPSIKAEDNVVYILNDKILEKDFEGDLFFIDNKNFVDLKVINKKSLQENYNIIDKKFGVIIRTTKK